MALEFLTAATVEWLWEQQGKNLALKAIGKIREQWARFHWREAEARYRNRLRQQHSTTHLLGNPKNIPIEDIFTDVYVLDKPTAFQRFEIEELTKLPFDHESVRLPMKRRPVLRIAVNEKRLFILGKPGAGKTTLLKYLTLQACAGKISRTPVFISMKEWADSGQELLPFLAQQFAICSFPDAQAFIEQLLGKGNAMVLFDGLDEVNIEGEQRSKMIQTLIHFSKRYPASQICITCRVAATDYSFDRFTYLEIADFDNKQILSFASKWYHNDPVRLDRFTKEFQRPENKRLRELAQTPLLLALLCLAFDETLSFPARRADLYREAIDALLKKWDASRGIRRDDIYRNLSPVRKEQMLARIAAQNFENGVYFLRREKLEKQIRQYVEQLPTMDEDLPDGESILRAIEAQHGVLVERAHGIYSFSHLSFQEYFTARYMVENAHNGTIQKLLQNSILDDRWREVILLTASLLDNADLFFDTFLEEAGRLIEGDSVCMIPVRWAYDSASYLRKPGAAARFFLLFMALAKEIARIPTSGLDFPGAKALNQNLLRNLENACYHSLSTALTLSHKVQIDMGRIHENVRKISRGLAGEMGIPGNLNIDVKWSPTVRQTLALAEYIEACHLLVDCLQLAALRDRSGVENRLLQPISRNRY